MLLDRPCLLLHLVENSKAKFDLGRFDRVEKKMRYGGIDPLAWNHPAHTPRPSIDRPTQVLHVGSLIVHSHPMPTSAAESEPLQEGSTLAGCTSSVRDVEVGAVVTQLFLVRHVLLPFDVTRMMSMQARSPRLLRLCAHLSADFSINQIHAALMTSVRIGASIDRIVQNAEHIAVARRHPVQLAFGWTSRRQSDPMPM